MLSESAQILLADIFQRQDLFGDLPRIRKRIVKWGPDAEPVELDHSSVIVSEEQLLGRLGLNESGAVAEAGWTICAAPPLPESTTEHRFGTRMASLIRVEMKDRDACWIESVEDGWLFLNSGWLIATGAGPPELLAQSTLVQRQVSVVDSAIAQFTASPRIATPLGGDGRICCGSAAIAFDPLCGDGTAHAVREAILASAVIRAAARGEDPVPLLAHYEARLTAGFQRHLAQCREFYSSGGSGAWWHSETEALNRGLDWCRRKLAEHGPFRFRLNGLDLEPVPS